MSALNLLPEATGAVVVLSGGLDSTIAMRIAVAKYGAENVRALTFNYGQRQAVEIEKARESTAKLGVKHKVLDLSILGDIAQGFSANVDRNVQMPTIKEVLGAPQPVTYVPNRNMILLSLAASFAEVEKCNIVITGLQVHDSYGYWDTSQKFVDNVNRVIEDNRQIQIKIIAPFSMLNKKEEIDILTELDGNVDLLMHTITCYDPTEDGKSCGRCPSCSERIMNFAKAGYVDPIAYNRDIDWNKIIGG